MMRRIVTSIAAVSLAAGIMAGCGGDAAGTSGDSAQAGMQTTVAVAPPAAPPTQRTGPLQKGEVVAPTTRSPKAFGRALDAKRPVVVAMLMRGIADEDFVAAALRQAEASDVGRGAGFLTYDINTDRGFGDLPLLLGMTGTPSVVVIAGDGSVVNSWSGVVDEEMIRQALSEARDSTPTG